MVVSMESTQWVFRLICINLGTLSSAKGKKRPSATLMDSSTKAKVDLLCLYLENLPNSIPHVNPGGISKYNFSHFC